MAGYLPQNARIAFSSAFTLGKPKAEAVASSVEQATEKPHSHLRSRLAVRPSACPAACLCPRAYTINALTVMVPLFAPTCSVTVTGLLTPLSSSPSAPMVNP